MALEKGTEEWMFWGDFFQFAKKYWDVEDSDEYWASLIKAGNELHAKYNSYMSKKFILCFWDIQSKKYRGII